MTEQQSQSAVGFQHKTRKQKPRKDPNAPFIREKLKNVATCATAHDFSLFPSLRKIKTHIQAA